MKVHEACKKHGCSVSSFFLWLSKHQEFSDAYAHAREIRFEQLAEETLQIPDDVPDGIMWETPDGQRFAKFDDVPEELQSKAKLKGILKEVVMKAELRVKARQWYLERLAPKFGAKVAMTHKGDAENPVEFTLKIDNS